MTSVRRCGALLLVLALSACTSSVQHAAAPVSSAAPVVSTPAPTTAAAPATTPAAPVSSVSTPSSPVSTSTAAAPSSSPAPQSTCTHVTVRVLPGGASPGEEIAALQFTNAGSTPCELVGYPSATLLLHGRQIGLPSQPSTPGVASARRLAPGDTAESLLHDYTQTCQAPLSDSLRVVVPGSAQTYLRPGMQLRACVVRVDKLGAPD